jgi:signal transduction histidine kinase
MKTPLRLQFMTWLTVQTLVVFAILAGILFAFNYHERQDHPDLAAEEAEEFTVTLATMLLSLPVLLGVAWIISRRQLAPLRAVLHAAESIRHGQLQQPIETPVKTDEIGRLAATINDAFGRYQDALRRLDRFSRDAAHQLRNPLAAIRATAEVSLQQPRSDAEYQDALAKIAEETQRLGHVVEQLLTLARLDRHGLRQATEPVNLTELTRAMVTFIQPAWEERGIECRIEIPEAPVTATGLPRLLEQAIANLLDNASHFTPAHGRIAVKLVAGGGAARLSIADSGPGLPETLRHAPVEQFGDLASRRVGGTGLGLAIVADIVRAHGGTLTARNSEWGGAEFELMLPAN